MVLTAPILRVDEEWECTVCENSGSKPCKFVSLASADEVGDLSHNEAHNMSVCLHAQNLIQIILFPLNVLADSIIFPHSVCGSVIRQGQGQDLPLFPPNQRTICFKTFPPGRPTAVITKIHSRLNSVVLRIIILLKQPSWDLLLTKNQCLQFNYAPAKTHRCCCLLPYYDLLYCHWFFNYWEHEVWLWHEQCWYHERSVIYPSTFNSTLKFHTWHQNTTALNVLSVTLACCLKCTQL